MDLSLPTQDGTKLPVIVMGNPQGDPVVFLHALGADAHQWDPQHSLSDHFQLIIPTLRGHGSAAAPNGPYQLQQLATDILDLLDGLMLDRVHLCGLSLGGLIAQWIAVYHPYRLRTLTLANTAARIGSRASWEERIEHVSSTGLEPLVDVTMARWFTPPFHIQEPDIVAATKATFLTTPTTGYLGCCAALRDADLSQEITQISVPTLLIGGSDDPTTTPADLQRLHCDIAGSELHIIDNTAHLTNKEAPAEFTNQLRTHFQRNT
jgi:3-oxoadipate enol-lactonase